MLIHITVNSLNYSKTEIKYFGHIILLMYDVHYNYQLFSEVYFSEKYLM